jgi:predicted transposase/invertase (TIGR01784 family)
MPRYLDPKSDLTFKRVFGEHKNLCISLINSMIPFETGREAVDIEYMTGELVPPLPELKNSIVDVRCKDTRGRQFIVEMQLNWDDSFKQRVLFNSSKIYVDQLGRGKDVKLLHPVYSLNFVNKVFEREPELNAEYFHHYRIVHIRHTEKRIEGMEFIFIELPKFKPQNRAEKKLHELWLRFLTEINENTQETPPELLACPETNEALNYMEIAAYTREQMVLYDIHNAGIYFAARMRESSKEEGREEGLEKGRAEGREKGLAEGREEGIKEGEEKGREEGMKESRLQIARNSLAAGLPVETVAQITGLTHEQIISLK